eukprot:12192175-Alexandrium_andersonii.AAC.1
MPPWFASLGSGTLWRSWTRPATKSIAPEPTTTRPGSPAGPGAGRGPRALFFLRPGGGFNRPRT